MSEPREFGPCPKCGHEATARFHDGEPHCKDCRREGIVPPSCRYFDVCGEKGIRAEHFVLTCGTCHFSWTERLGEPAPTPEPAP